MSDLELLHRYLNEGSQEAFAEIQRRYAGLVYSTACRLVSNHHAAEDITQEVFVRLARKVQDLQCHTVLPGWLYRCARNVALETIRGEQRRRQGEQAADQIDCATDTEDSWTQIKPLLDRAMESLRTREHDAVVLRYFQNKSLKEVGAALGWSEDAAQKRVSRALERLHKTLTANGTRVPLSQLGAVLSSEAVQPAPAVVIHTLVSTPVIAAAPISPTAPALSLMATTKLKSLGLAAAFCALSAGLLVLWMENNTLRTTLSAPRSSVPLPDARHSGSGAESNQVLITGDQLRQYRREHLELLSLRGRVTQLSRALNNPAAARPGETSPTNEPAATEDSLIFTASLRSCEEIDFQKGAFHKSVQVLLAGSLRKPRGRIIGPCYYWPDSAKTADFGGCRGCFAFR